MIKNSLLFHVYGPYSLGLPSSSLLYQGLGPLYNNKLGYKQQQHTFLPLLCGNVNGRKKILKPEMGLQLDIVF
jgi:hypothetical protein